jgi:repressor LexA
LIKNRSESTCTSVHVLFDLHYKEDSLVRCAKQFEVLEFITEEKRRRGYPPSLGDIAKRFGFSRNAARQHSDALVVKGLLAKDPYRGHYLPLDEVARKHETSVTLAD